MFSTLIISHSMLMWYSYPFIFYYRKYIYIYIFESKNNLKLFTNKEINLSFYLFLHSTNPQ